VKPIYFSITKVNHTIMTEGDFYGNVQTKTVLYFFRDFEIKM